MRKGEIIVFRPSTTQIGGQSQVQASDILYLLIRSYLSAQAQASVVEKDEE